MRISEIALKLFLKTNNDEKLIESTKFVNNFNKFQRIIVMLTNKLKISLFY